MNIQKHRVLLLLFILFPFIYNAQTEVEMKAQADKLFDSEQYLSATPLYLRLLSLQPREFAYNYKYGTCLLYNSNNKQDAIKYLSFAINDPAISPDAYYFLGRALHLNYQFNEAIKQYTRYLEKNPNGNKVKDAEREIQMCQNGKRLMTTITDIIVSDKKEITADKFFRIYDLQDIGGDLLVTADFQTKLDKKNDHVPLVHFPQNASLIYYSSYGDDGNTGKDIYVRRKLPDGSWGMPQQIQGNVNTAFDEDFPYMHPDGNYLYFSSKGHNSMGGYDVFRSKFDPDNNSFGPPENMDFAVSSPDDDVFYVVDSLNKNAYFASARQSESGKLFVYKVNVDRVPLQLAVIKGNFVSEIDPKIKKINFEIKDYANGEVIGKFNSNDKAVYLITFPKGGKYEYNMKIEGSVQEFKFIVSIPFMKEFKPLKQKIIHTMEEGREVVKIVNLFDEEVDDPAAVLAEVIKMRSNLNVNIEEFDMNEVEKDKINKEILDDLGLGDLLLVEVSDVLNKELKKGAENNNLINNIGNNINNLVVENSVEFIALEEQIKNKVAEANKTQNQENKYILLKEAESLIVKQAEIKNYSKDLLHLNDSIKEVLSKSTSGADQQKLLSVSKQFDQLYKAGNEKEAIQLIVENKTFLQDILKDNSTELVQNLVDKVVRYDDEISSLKGKVDGYNKDVKTLEIEMQSLQNSIGAVKKKDVPAIEQKIAEKQEEIKLIKEELGNIQSIIDRKSQEKYLVNKQIQILQDAISNKSIAVVTKEKAAKALAETEKTNSNTLTTYVSQQIVALEKEDPTLKERIVVASGLKASNIIEEYKTSSKGIQDDPSLSNEDKMYKQLLNDRNAYKILDKRLAEIEKSLIDNKFDENLNKEKQEIIKYQKELEVLISNRENQVAALLSQNGTGDSDELIQTIQPGYEAERKSIEANVNLNETEKLQELNNEDEQLLAAIDKELKVVSTELAKNPSDKTLQKKKQALIEIKQNTNTIITQRNTEIDAAKNTNETPNINDIIAEVDPIYDDKIEEVKADNDLTNEEELKAITEIDKTLIEKIDNELTQVNEKLSTVPSNEVLINKRNALVALKATKENAIKEREEQIVRASTSESSSEVTNALIEKIQPGYAKEISIINNNTQLSSDEKMSQLQLKDQKLMTAIDAKLVALEKQLEKQPNNESLKEEKRKLLELKSLIESRIEERVQLMDSKSNVELTAESIVEQKNILRNKIDPSYISKRESSVKSNDSDLKKKNAELKLEQQLLEKIQAEIAIAQKIVDKDPFNVAAKSKLTVLTELKKETQNNINSINGDVVALKNGQPINSVTEQEKQATINDLSEEYVANVREIENSTEISEKEKAQQLIDEEKALLNAVEEKKQDVEGQLVKDPGNQTLLKEQAVLAQIEKDIQEKVAQNEAVLDMNEPAVFVSQEEKEEIINRLNDAYFSDVKAIEQSNQIDLEKLEQVQLLDQKLLGKVYDQLENVENQLIEDPSSVELKKEQEILNALSEELDRKIENRQIEIAQKTVNSTLTTEVKEAAINKIDPSYFKNIEAINQLDSNESEKNQKLLNEEISLLSKVNNELFSIEEALMNNPDDQVKIEERKKLGAIRSDLQASIEQLNEQKNQLSSETTVTTQQKTAKIEEIDAPYVAQKKTIEGNNNLSIKEKAQQLLRLENDFLDKVTTEKIKIQERLNQSPNNNSLKQELAVLEAIQLETETLIAANKNVLNNANESVDNPIDKEQIVADILPDYTSRKEELANSKMVENIKIVEQIKLENELLTKLQLEENSLNKQLDKNPTDEKNQQKLASVRELIANQKAVIPELAARNTELNAQIKATEIISKADVNYTADIEKLKASTSDTKNSDLAEREVIHQERIATQMAANEKILAKKDNPEIFEANNALNNELIRSKESEQNYRIGNVDAEVVENRVGKTAFVTNLREDLLQGNSTALTEEFKTIKELKQQDVILANYEKALSTQISKKSNELNNDAENDALKEEVTWMKEELINVQERRRQWKISIGELEKIANEDPTIEGNEFNDPLLTELTQKEEKLQSDLTNSELTPKEKQVIQKELTQVQKEQSTQENKLITNEIALKEKVIEAQTKQLKAGSALNTETKLTSETAIAQQESLSKEVKRILKEAQETKSVEEKNYLLNSALQMEKQANTILEEAIIENKFQQLAKENNITSLETQVTLEEKKRRYSIQVGELTRIIKELDYEISKAKGKELIALNEERKEIVQQRILVQQQLEALDALIAQQEKTATTTNPEAMKKSISYIEEQEIAATEEYKNYQEKAKPALEVEKQIAILEAQLNAEKSITKELIKSSVDNPSEENQANLQVNIEKIKQMEAENETLLSELKTKQRLAKEALPSNTEVAMKMQNLVERGILPIKRLAVLAALVPLPASGLDIKVEGTNTYSAAKPIPVDVKNPTGLVYRVQVGAFANAIPQDLFKEFNPVSGEKLNNGVTRYMAGYFNNSKKVIEVRDQIKGLGYADAFAVAYCDGIRISLAEARILEANGECVAKGENELILEVAANTAITMGLEEKLNISNVDELSYNKLPGAVIAEPIEKHLGLFFTVQIGVYNKPVNANTVYNISSLMTVRLPNGQIRYSTGMFSSIENARPKKLEVIEKGVKDAFITAYYKAERITLAEAQKLLDDNGVSILEGNMKTPIIRDVVDPIKVVIADEPLIENKIERIQIITKKTFDEFPREILNRYNSHGSFYYDETDKRVKSAIADSKDELPQVYHFKEDVDTVYIMEALNESSTIVSVKFESKSLPGDFIDWLLRYNYRREFIQSEETIELRIYRIPDVKMEELQLKLELFGLTWSKVIETEQELELEEK